jgi:hypothetical protein
MRDDNVVKPFKLVAGRSDTALILPPMIMMIMIMAASAAPRFNYSYRQLPIFEVMVCGFLL